MTIQLPHKLSELAQIALDDLAAVSARPGFEIGLWWWVRDMYLRNTCAVCAGGAVMVARLGLDPETGEEMGHDWIIQTFGKHNALALVAIDALRQGMVGVALSVLESGAFQLWVDSPDPGDWNTNSELRLVDHELSRVMPEDYGDGFRSDMSKLITDLKAAGL